MNHIKDLCLSRAMMVIYSLMLVLFSSCNDKQRLIGKWHKIAGGFCGLAYPAKVEFFGDGEYVGELPNWNGGNYHIVDTRRLRLDTLTGPGVYEFKVSDNTLTF